MSSGSESDEDYVPGEPEQVSEEGSADEDTDLQYDKEQEQKAQKRKAIKESKGKKRRKTKNGAKESEPEPEEEEKDDEPQKPLDSVEEKKREDDLWAKFLEGTDTKSQPTPKATTANIEPVKPVNTTKTTDTANKQNDDDDSKDREKRIFEFAGETIVVENNVIKEKIKTAEAPTTVSKLQGPSRGRSSGGLSGILGQLNKKDKLSTLEKSKLDWVTYKQEEGIEEEIQSHNKGKSGYLDRQDFLERADHRQYEIERDLRMSRRSNR